MFEKIKYPIIEHLKSGISVSTHIGCTLGCPYCLLYAGDKEKSIHQIADAKKLVEQLELPKALFLNGQTPIIVNNRTDPFLPQVYSSTKELLDKLIEKKITSPVVLISKLFPAFSLYEYCKKLHLLFFYSYSGLAEDINFNCLDKLNNLKKVIPLSNCIHYLRPIIENHNNDKRYLCEVLSRFAKTGFAGSVISGFRITSGNMSYAEKTSVKYNGDHKIIEASLFNDLAECMHHDYPSYNLYRHTSCAIDSFMKRANRLLYFNKSNACNPFCPNKSNCDKQSLISKRKVEHIRERFPNLDINTCENGINIKGQVSQEVVAFIKNAFGISVNAEQLILSPSEKEIKGE